MTSSQHFSDIYHERRLGDLSIDEEKIIWKFSSDMQQQQQQQQQKELSIRGEDITHAEWSVVAQGRLLRVWKERVAAEFSGFEESDLEIVRDTLNQNFGVQLKVIKTDIAGVNWGELDFHENGSILVFNDTHKERIFDMSLDAIKNCQKTPKSSELVLEFHEDPMRTKNDDVLSEVRFAFPKEDGEEDGESRIDALHKAILKKADVIRATGEAIASFDQLSFLAPRGRYTVDMYRKFFRMHGKTYDFKVPYNSVSVMFLLDKPDGHKYFVISLDVPVRTGKTPLYHLVLNFNSGKEYTEPKVLNLSSDEINSKFANKGLKKEMAGMEFEVVAKVFRALTGKKLIGAGKFTTSTGDKGIKCSVKADEGYLFVLEKSFLFLHKPTFYLRHEEIKVIRFNRADSLTAGGGHGTRSFDLMFVLKNGKKHTFNNIARTEYDPLVNYIQKKQLRVENLIDDQTPTYSELVEDHEDESDDEDFSADDDDDNDDAEFSKYVTDGVDAGEVATGKKRSRDDEEEEEVRAPAKKKRKSKT